jgi:hypothetical protein
VVDSKEWLFYKRHYGVDTPSNVNMFAGRDGRTVQVNLLNLSLTLTPGQILLQRSETVFLPFKFQSFAAAARGPEGAPGDGTAAFGGVQGTKASIGTACCCSLLPTSVVQWASRRTAPSR